MSNIAKAFSNGKAFIAFLTCADPDIETTKELIHAITDAGADLIELGIPFSDPTAEGPVIQAANVRALGAGATTDKIFDMVREIRQDISVPLVFMTYANVVFSYGTQKFLKTCAQIGMDGIILPDVPFEEKAEFEEICQNYGLDFISLIAPTSKDRIAMIAKEAKGFVYCVSSLGVTGERNEISSNVGEMIRLVKNAADIPAAIGFGISTPKQARAMADISDGVIVGSAIVRIIGEHGKGAVPYVYEYVKTMKEALND